MATTTRNAMGPSVSADVLPERRKREWPAWLRALGRNPISIVGTVIVLGFVLVALFAPVLAPPEFPSQPYQMPRDGFTSTPQPPSPEHPFGTTQGQYDIYYGVVWGTRTAFKVGLLITAITVMIGGLVGAVSGYVGGWFDEVIQRIVEIVMAFPFLLAAITMAVVLAPKLQDKMLSAIVALIVFSWPSYARIIRGDVLAIKQRNFVDASRALGSPHWRILFRHILPNSVFTLLVVASLDIGTYVLSFAALSFLGLGPGEGYADWGQLISLARNWIPSLATYWYIVVFPGAALVLFVLGWNLIGDAFRDALDPKMRNQ
jgi:peptide/nickel transport system permease protein